MTKPREVSPNGPDSGDSEFTIGCLVGALSGVIGDAVGTGALLVLHPDWIFGEGRPLTTVLAGLVPGWAVGLVVAVLVGLLLIRLMSRAAGDSPATDEAAKRNVVLIFVVPALIAAGTLWFLASVNR